MFNVKKLFEEIGAAQKEAFFVSFDAFAEFTGTESNTYVKNIRKFVESSVENAQKIVEGQPFFSGVTK